jgi:hypothetical protein
MEALRCSGRTRSPPSRYCGSAEPVRPARSSRQHLNRSLVQGLADHTGVGSVCGQRFGVGRAYARRTLSITVSDTTLAIELDDGDVHVARRTTISPAVTIKARSPRTVTTET